MCPVWTLLDNFVFFLHHPERNYDQMKKHYSIKDLARFLSISERTIHRALKSKRLVGSRIGKLWRFTEEDLQAWKEATLSEK